MAVLFYAGHGIEVGGINYLIPVDARLATDYDVKDETLELDRVLEAMAPAKRLRLVILDACRENPFVKGMKRTVAGRDVGRGLGRFEPPVGNTLIAFATKPNAIALDGKGPNSPFTAALVKHLATLGTTCALPWATCATTCSPAPAASRSRIWRARSAAASSRLSAAHPSPLPRSRSRCSRMRQPQRPASAAR